MIDTHTAPKVYHAVHVVVSEPLASSVHGVKLAVRICFRHVVETATGRLDTADCIRSESGMVDSPSER
jgi:hypothetical protein